jgi:dihydropyrimidinase
MTDFDLLLTGGRVVLESGERRADVAIAGGIIAAVLDGDHRAAAREVIDLAGKVVLPGVVDPHTHVTLGPPDGWFTETRAAAIAGITTVLDFQLRSSSYAEAFPAIRGEADARVCVDYGMHFCPSVEPHLDELDRWVGELGVSSFKFYMNFRGEEGAYLGVAGTDDGYLWELCRRVARHERALLCLHTENIEIATRLQARAVAGGGHDVRAWGAARPPITEAENVHRAAFLAGESRCPIYIVHLSSAMALREVRRARAAGVRIHAETCPQYLAHTEDSPLGLLAKCNPPLRSAGDVEALWEGLLDGSIDTVGSDHVPRPRAAKGGDLWKAARGTPTLSMIVPVLLHEGVGKRGMSLGRVAELISATPARLFNLHPRKGTIRVGSDADLTVVDLGLEREVRWQDLGSYADYTLWEGQRLRGWPVLTIARGHVIARDGRFRGRPGAGRYLAR